MPRFLTARQAVDLIRDGDHICVNAFLALNNPVELNTALSERFRETGSPRNLSVFSGAFGFWAVGSPAEGYLRDGAVKSIVLSHYASIPDVAKMVLDNRIEGYNLPLGAMSHMIREAARGRRWYDTEIGLNLFVDPECGGGYRLNESARDTWIHRVEVEGRPMLRYRVPELDVALIKGSSVDRYGNISFESECCTVDALSLAMAVRRRGGLVLVQVKRVIEGKMRPRDVVIPGALATAVVVCPEQRQVAPLEGYEPSYAGDEFIPPAGMSAWVLSRPPGDPNREAVARRAVRELAPGQIVNIGVGIPESVAVLAAKSGLLEKVTLTVESGGMGGLPAPGVAFGATIGAHSIYDMAQQFDFYDGGGLDICFIGALEIDKTGNVNGHNSPGKLSGVGGFADITQATKKVVFCAAFSSGGLETSFDGDGMRIVREGRHPKLIERVSAVSFSAKNALEAGQEILYVTERCVFRLTPGGLMLTEISKGIDLKRDILDRMPFMPLLDPSLKS